MKNKKPQEEKLSPAEEQEQIKKEAKVNFKRIMAQIKK